jgi:mannose-6-phosphate isomerase-like protein (cupin superfamily)
MTCRTTDRNFKFTALATTEDDMGRVITFAQLPTHTIADGVSRAAITQGETREMAADLVRIDPAKRWAASAPQGSDCYLFMLEGTAAISAGGVRHPLPRQTFATVQEGVEFEIQNEGRSPARIVRVLAPPLPSARLLAGFRGKIKVAERARTPAVAQPEQKKQRLYFVGHHGAQSERGHAMIVVYEKDTVTGLHHHPNAESMFVLLDGALRFSVNGKEATIEPGQAAYFGMNDSHGLRVADGHAGASFLEFHIPAAYTTVRQ